jgi:cyclase
MRSPPLHRLLIIGTLLGAAASAWGQQPPDFSKVEIKTTRLAEDFYTLEGQGGTISVLTGPDGVLLVDSQFGPLADKLLAAIRRISDKPIRFLINTHVHGDHTGGNENFAKLGALIFSRDQLRTRLESGVSSSTSTLCTVSLTLMEIVTSVSMLESDELAA